jgi:hypothetical protein
MNGKEKRAARKRRVSAAKLTVGKEPAGNGRVTRSRVEVVDGGKAVEGGFKELFI